MINDQCVGTIGDIGCYSFYPSKNLGCYGDGGAIVTNQPDLADELKKLSDYGQSSKFNHEMIGYNSRLDTLQAAVLNTKMPYLNDWNVARRNVAKWYHTELQNIGVKLPTEAVGAKSVYHLFVIQIENRDACLEYLQEKGIMAQVHYPSLIHLQPCYAHLGYGLGDFPVAEAAVSRILSLPMYPELTQEQVSVVVNALSSFLRRETA